SEVHVPAAVGRIAAALRACAPERILLLGSANLSNEENYLLRKIADHLGCANRDAVVDGSRVRKMKSKAAWIEGDHAAANHAGAAPLGAPPARVRRPGIRRPKLDAARPAPPDPERGRRLWRRHRRGVGGRNAHEEGNFRLGRGNLGDRGGGRLGESAANGATEAMGSGLRDQP